MEAVWEKNGATFVVDGSPMAMAMTLFSRSIYTPNSRKRIDRIERLAAELGAKVHYPMNDQVAGIYVHIGKDAYECISYRQTERLLRELKRKSTK